MIKFTKAEKDYVECINCGRDNTDEDNLVTIIEFIDEAHSPLRFSLRLCEKCLDNFEEIRRELEARECGKNCCANCLFNDESFHKTRCLVCNRNEQYSDMFDRKVL